MFTCLQIHHHYCPITPPIKHLPGFLECWRSPDAEESIWVFNPESLGIWEQVGFTASIEQRAKCDKSASVLSESSSGSLSPCPRVCPFPSGSAPSPFAILSRYLFLSRPPVSRYFSAAARCLDSKSWVSVLGWNNVAAALEGFSMNRWLIVNKVQSQWLVCGVQ